MPNTLSGNCLVSKTPEKFPADHADRLRPMSSYGGSAHLDRPPIGGGSSRKRVRRRGSGISFIAHSPEGNESSVDPSILHCFEGRMLESAYTLKSHRHHVRICDVVVSEAPSGEVHVGVQPNQETV